ncbi:hypothetical protein JD844_025493 [Phrynosoma platyrhinos]|uniref:EGF-like domain-containing protein n=1 Tax=Phrynosoma platyrhinos TaxID=52577 RepID=A0ABQ7T0H8_PHRPL|nr:hypothetical protein JD844_025493 [Phrynosoma platyrhinos]
MKELQKQPIGYKKKLNVISLILSAFFFKKKISVNVHLISVRMGERVSMEGNNTDALAQRSGLVPTANIKHRQKYARIFFFLPAADVNECKVYKLEGASRLCMHTCINIPGSYRCSCPSGYRLFGDGKSCEDIDECVLSLHNCSTGTMCVNTGGGFQCVNSECPKPSGNVSYVKTSPFQCERTPCPMDSRSCHYAPKTISFHYLPLPSNLVTPTVLFRMATASAPGRPGPDSLRFGIVGGNSRGHFVMQRSDRQTGELILVQSLQGPQTIQVEVDMSEYLGRSFQAKHVSKITIFVSAYEF